MPDEAPPRADPAAARAALGPLTPLLDDPTVSEIMVNGPERVFVERRGKIERAAVRFESVAALETLVRGLATAVGKTLGATNPFVDGRLADGSRFNAVVAPVAVDGPALTIRIAHRGGLQAADLQKSGFWDARIAAFLEACVRARLNVIVGGGSGSGKTTLLNVLGSFVPASERIVTIEDTAELHLAHDDVVRLESRPPAPGDPGVSTRALVVNALRMRPDRILIGECRASEAFDLLIAMNTGHDGSMTTVHSNSARDALQRLESMVLMAGTDMPMKVIRQYVARAIHVVVQTQRGADGVRRVVEVIELGGMEGEVILTQDVFRHAPREGFQSTRTVPQVMRTMRERGVVIPVEIFGEGYVSQSVRPR